jgi:ABC-type transport system involved in multi-copper enzyme maturation permease subunit
VIGIVRAEWLKLRTTAVPWVLMAIALIINALFILTLFLTPNNSAGASNGGGFGAGGGGSSAASGIGNSGYLIPHNTQQLRNLVGSGLPCYIFALLLGTLMVTTEFRHKTVTTSFLVTPRRPVLVTSKLASAALIGAALALIMVAGSLLGGGLTLVARGGSFSALARQIPAVAPGMILVFALFAILGVGVGSILTNQVAAIIVVLGWFLIVENILVGLVHSALRWVPTGAASAAASVTRGHGSTFGLFAWWEGALLMLGYGLIFALIGSAILTQRDIT